MERAKKEQVVTSLKNTFQSSNTIVIAHYRGLNVIETNELRKKAREGGSSLRVIKNSLAKIASDKTKFDNLSELFTGPTAIATSEDAVAAAKVIVDFAANNEKLVIIGGSIDGKLLDESGVKSLAKTPSLNQSRAKLIGLLNAPASALVGLVKAPAGKVARVISARGAQEV